jgi:chromosome segregation ATPase
MLAELRLLRADAAARKAKDEAELAAANGGFLTDLADVDEARTSSAPLRQQLEAARLALAEERRQMREASDAAVAEVQTQLEEARQQLVAHQALAASTAAATEGEHMRAAEELERLYELKLAAEAGKYEAVRRQAEEASAAFERQIHAVHAACRGKEERLAAELDAARADGDRRERAALREAEAVRVRYEETLAQEEEYGEVVTAQAMRDKVASVEAEREVQRQLRGEAAVLRRKIESVAAEAECARQQVGAREEQLAAAQRERAEAERTIHLLRRELTERGAKIGDLERRMSEIKVRVSHWWRFAPSGVVRGVRAWGIMGSLATAGAPPHRISRPRRR